MSENENNKTTQEKITYYPNIFKKRRYKRINNIIIMAEVTFVNIKKKDFFDENATKSTPPLFKHMPLVYAFDLLQNHHLWFASPESWKDPFEQRFYAAQYEDLTGARSIPFPWKDKVLCTCFTTKSASEAHWKRGSTNSIMLHFDRGVLLKLLENLPNDFHVYIGKVEYMQTRDIQRANLSEIPFKERRPSKLNLNNYCARLLLLKRNAFSYEEEIRVMIVKEKQSLNAKKQSQGEYLLKWLEENKLIKKVTLSPLQSKDENQKLKEFISTKFGLEVLKSRLYNAPKPRKIMKW